MVGRTHIPTNSEHLANLPVRSRLKPTKGVVHLGQMDVDGNRLSLLRWLHISKLGPQADPRWNVACICGQNATGGDLGNEIRELR